MWSVSFVPRTKPNFGLDARERAERGRPHAQHISCYCTVRTRCLFTYLLTRLLHAHTRTTSSTDHNPHKRVSFCDVWLWVQDYTRSRKLRGGCISISDKRVTNGSLSIIVRLFTPLELSMKLAPWSRQARRTQRADHVGRGRQHHHALRPSFCA